MQDLKWKTKNIENTKKKYFRSLVDRGPPQRRKIRMENQKKSRKPKKRKNKKKSEVLWIGAIPKESWNIVFFLFSRCFLFGFLRVFLLFSKGPSPKSLGILFVFLLFFCFFCFSRVFFLFFLFSQGFFIFSKGPSPKSLGIAFFSRVFFWFTQGFFLFSPRGPPQRVLEYCFFPHLPGEGC